MRKLYIFNGIYGVIATSKEEAKRKVAIHLRTDHQWYLRDDAECTVNQGHLVIEEREIADDVVILRPVCG